MEKRLRSITEFVVAILALLVFAVLLYRYYYNGIQLSYKLEAQRWLDTVSLKIKGTSYPKRSGLVSDQKQAQGVPVLLYHGIGSDDPEDMPRELFEDQMLSLKVAGYQTITVRKLYEFLRSAESLPENAIVITFDDGRKDSYYPVDPILNLLDFSAVLFVINAHALQAHQSPYYLNKQEITWVANNPRWELQAHSADGHGNIVTDDKGTVKPFFSGRKWIDNEKRSETIAEYTQRVGNDLMQSREQLNQFLGGGVFAFAFPFGDYGQKNIKFLEAMPILKEISQEIFALTFFQFAPDTHSGYYRYNYPQQNDRVFARRILVPADATGDQLIQMLAAGKPKQLPFVYSDFTNSYHWVFNKNKNTESPIDAPMLHFKSPENKGYFAAYLDGSQHWTNYKFSSDINFVAGKKVGLVARSENGDNYVSCNFGDKSVEIEQVLNGERVTKVVRTNILVPEFSNVAIEVVGNEVGCFLNKRQIVRSFSLDPTLNHGGIGYKVWAEDELLPAEIVVLHLEVISAE